MDSSAPAEKAPLGSRPLIRLGIGVTAAVFGGLALWSVAAPIDSAVVAAGQVVVEGNRKAVQHLEGGVVSAILVREGNEVAAGDVLVRLDDVVQKANLTLIDGQLTEFYARRVRLETERDQASEIAPVRGIPEILTLPDMRERMEGQRELLEARRKSRMTQAELLNERIVQQRERIRGFEAQIVSLAAQRDLIGDELAGMRDLNARGYATMTRVRELEREEERLQGEGGALRAGVAESLSIIAEARLEIERLNEAGREEAIAELRDVEVAISELEEKRLAAADALRRTVIRAPSSGKVLGLAIHTVGGVIAPGAPLMEIVPGEDRLEAAVRIAPQDVDNVRAGQRTRVRFSALGSRRTPEADGIVRTVSADSFIDQNLGAAYYLVVVEIPEGEELVNILKGHPLAPGMPVEALIQTGSQPAISYLLKPLTDAMTRSLREE